MTDRWQIVPSGDFAEKALWKFLGDDRWAALRLRLLYVCTDGKEARLGPVVEEHDVAKGDKITVRFERKRVVTQTESINDAIRVATTAKITEGLSSKIGSELAAKAPGFSGKIQSELSAHSEFEITGEVERTLTTETSHSLEDTQGREYEIELSGEGGPRRAKLRRRYWPRQWDFYVHSFDYLELSYRRRWLWKDIRKTMKRVNGQPLGWPLLSLTFFEPQPDLIVSYEAVEDELENPDAFEIRPLSKGMPAKAGPRLKDLEDAARLAFPVSKAERTAAKQYKLPKPAPTMGFAGTGRRRKIAAKKKAGGKRAFKKGAKRKGAVKRRKVAARRKSRTARSH
jgi:hypothetical protein